VEDAVENSISAHAARAEIIFIVNNLCHLWQLLHRMLCFVVFL